MMIKSDGLQTQQVCGWRVEKLKHRGCVVLVGGSIKICCTHLDCKTPIYLLERKANRPISDSLIVQQLATLSGCCRTRVCAVEDRVCVGVELLSEDGAVVHVTRVGKALRCIFKQQITFSILMRLKEPELCVWVDGQSFLYGQKTSNKYI